MNAPWDVVAIAVTLTAPARMDTTRATVVVVRHAERESADRDSPLSAAGRARAAALDSTLADAHVTAIIVTQYRRTAETAALVAQHHHIVPTVVAAQADVPAHALAVATAVHAAASKGGVVLVVGHSNTVPSIVHALGGPASRDLCDGTFDQLFTVIRAADQQPLVIRGRYGASDAPGANACAP